MKSLRPALLLLVASTAGTAAPNLSPLASPPDWSSLNEYQQSITREDFLFLLEEVYAPFGAWKGVIRVDATTARVETRPGEDPFVLRFAQPGQPVQPVTRFWRAKAQLGPRTAAKPLLGVRIAIDPGHIGGSYAKMEERWFQIGDSKPVTEGDMTLAVSRLLTPRLEALGATVFVTRRTTAPTTSLRATRLLGEARTALRDRGRLVTRKSVQDESERLFYRVAEIRKRAEIVNKQFKPDVVICLHFNAESWGDPDNPTLVDKNHLHFLVSGAFSEGELTYEDQRFEMLDKLLSRIFREELAVTESVAASMAKATGLPAFVYLGPNAVKVGSSPFVWARNLLANRLYRCPVVFLEPYVMNSQPVFKRVQAGDFEGKQAVDGKMQESIFREYARGIV
ncbi:MAG: N-acetylmuramoyl-L-alanine amidase, partial [Chthoniobacterales bacterium]